MWTRGIRFESLQQHRRAVLGARTDLAGRKGAVRVEGVRYVTLASEIAGRRAIEGRRAAKHGPHVRHWTGG